MSGLAQIQPILRQTRARIVRHPWFVPANRIFRLVFTGALLAYLAHSLAQLGWARVWHGLPTSGWFYVLLLASYLIQPGGEWLVYRYLWRPLPFSLFMRKRVYSSTVFSYSGEAYLFLWARRHLILPEGLLLHAIKDSNILSAVAGLLVMFGLLSSIAVTGEWRLPVISQGTPDFSALETEQVARLGHVKAARNAIQVRNALDAVAAAAPSYLSASTGVRVPLMPLIVDAVRARASVGEIADTLERVWGRYQPGS